MSCFASADSFCGFLHGGRKRHPQPPAKGKPAFAARTAFFSFFFLAAAAMVLFLAAPASAGGRVRARFPDDVRSLPFLRPSWERQRARSFIMNDDGDNAQLEEEEEDAEDAGELTSTARGFFSAGPDDDE